MCAPLHGCLEGSARRIWPARASPVRSRHLADAFQRGLQCCSKQSPVVLLHRRRPVEGRQARAGVRRLLGIVCHAEEKVHERGGVLR